MSETQATWQSKALGLLAQRRAWDSKLYWHSVEMSNNTWGAASLENIEVRAADHRLRMILGDDWPGVNQDQERDGVRFRVVIHDPADLASSELYVVVPTAAGVQLQAVETLLDLGEALERIQAHKADFVPTDQVGQAIELLQSGEPYYMVDRQDAAAYALGATMVEVLREFARDMAATLKGDQPRKEDQS